MCPHKPLMTNLVLFSNSPAVIKILTTIFENWFCARYCDVISFFASEL